jgi:hypothetical protein
MLIGIYSNYIKAAFNHDPWDDTDATFLGIDVIAIGEWSLLRAIQEVSVL